MHVICHCNCYLSSLPLFCVKPATCVQLEQLTNKIFPAGFKFPGSAPKGCDSSGALPLARTSLQSRAERTVGTHHSAGVRMVPPEKGDALCEATTHIKETTIDQGEFRGYLPTSHLREQ